MYQTHFALLQEISLFVTCFLLPNQGSIGEDDDDGIDDNDQDDDGSDNGVDDQECQQQIGAKEDWEGKTFVKHM